MCTPLHIVDRDSRHASESSNLAVTTLRRTRRVYARGAAGGLECAQTVRDDRSIRVGGIERSQGS